MRARRLVHAGDTTSSLQLHVKIPPVPDPAPDFRPPVPPEALAYRNVLRGAFWKHIPAYATVDVEQFLDHRWQAKNTITSPARLLAALQDLVSPGFLADAEAGFRCAPMSVRVSPYLLALIDWRDPYRDPLRRQFIPVESRRLPDHPKLELDSLHEIADSPVPGLTHRYYDKALFLAVDTCPVYCRFCTRSYAVGIDTEEVDKIHLAANQERWDKAFGYLMSRPEVEDVVVSGGDCYNLRPSQIEQIGFTLLDMPNIRRIRFGTKGPAVMPQKILTDLAWTDSLTRVVDRGRQVHKGVFLHTHFNHPNEITGITEDAINLLTSRGITVRNQSVLQRDVNDDVDVMKLLIRRLSYMNVQPYYVYVHDLVKGCEDLRTTLQTAIDVEKAIRGVTAGFNTPTFVCDAPGGGGKRDIHSYEHYDRTTGVSVFMAPSVKPGRPFLYFDPIDLLPKRGRLRWADPAEHEKMVEQALTKAASSARR